MEVKISPVSGCAQIVLGILTLGVFQIAKWLNERHWPKSVNEHGVITRGGTQIAWNEFNKIAKVVTNIGNTGSKTEHYELSSLKGKVVVAIYRLENGAQVFEYIWQHLPEQVKRA